MTKEEIEEILNTYKWIKVDKYVAHIPESNVDWRMEYFKLLEHHKKETTFLVDKTRQIVNENMKDDKRNKLIEDIAQHYVECEYYPDYQSKGTCAEVEEDKSRMKRILDAILPKDLTQVGK